MYSTFVEKFGRNMLSIVCRRNYGKKWRNISQISTIVRGVATSAEGIIQSVDENMPVEIEDPYKPVRKRCFLCGVRVDYKNVQLLSQFVSSYTGVPISQKTSGLCERKYEVILQNIKLSQRAGYMAFRTKETTFLEDPDITGNLVRSREFKSGSKSLPSTNANVSSRDSSQP